MHQPRYSRADLIKPLAIIVTIVLAVGVIVGLLLHAKLGAPSTETRVN